MILKWYQNDSKIITLLKLKHTFQSLTIHFNVIWRYRSLYRMLYRATYEKIWKFPIQFPIDLSSNRISSVTLSKPLHYIFQYIKPTAGSLCENSVCIEVFYGFCRLRSEEISFAFFKNRLPRNPFAASRIRSFSVPRIRRWRCWATFNVAIFRNAKPTRVTLNERGRSCNNRARKEYLYLILSAGQLSNLYRARNRTMDRNSLKGTSLRSSCS